MGTPLRLLLVEDDEDDAFLVTRHLRNSGFDLDLLQVDSAASFMGAIRERTWDVILSDYQMPGFSGFEALEILRGSEVDIPFLLVSGAIGEQIAVEAMRHGARDYLLKDNLARLAPAVRRELLEASERRARRRAETRQKTLERALQAILRGTSSQIGEEFFQSLVQALGTSLGFKGALVAEFDDSLTQARILAVHGLQMEPYSNLYDIKGTLTEDILLVGNSMVQDQGLRRYRDHELFEQDGIRSAIGIRLQSREGHPQGVLAVFDDKPMEEPSLTRDLLSIFAARAGSELDRLDSERQRREVEQKLFLSQKLEALGTLSGGIAHDINNILTSIWGHAQLLDATIQDEVSSESVHGILNGCQRARDLAKQILLFGRRQEPVRSAVSLPDLVDETFRLLSPSIPAGIVLEVEIPPGLPMVSGDSGQLHQVLMNLCTNALQAMEHLGEGRLRIRGGQEGSMVRLEVGDTGPGIPPQIQERIFEPFFSTKGPEKGTGLGLSVVHGIVLNHGGTIELRSSPGTDTVFVIRLPVQSAGDSSANPGSMVVHEAPGCRRILVVDDEPTVTEVLGQLLEILGWSSHSSNSAHKGLEFFADEHESLAGIICDFSMPGMTGVEFAARACELDPAVPVVVSSGYDSIEPSLTLPPNVVGFLGKPFQSSDLGALLNRCMGRRSI